MYPSMVFPFSVRPTHYLILRKWFTNVITFAKSWITARLTIPPYASAYSFWWWLHSIFVYQTHCSSRFSNLNNAGHNWYIQIPIPTNPHSKPLPLLLFPSNWCSKSTLIVSMISFSSSIVPYPLSLQSFSSTAAGPDAHQTHTCSVAVTSVLSFIRAVVPAKFIFYRNVSHSYLPFPFRNSRFHQLSTQFSFMQRLDSQHHFFILATVGVLGCKALFA